MRFFIHRARTLSLSTEDVEHAAIAHIMVSGMRIERVMSAGELPRSHDGATFDAEGLLALPGIVDIHGDAFERQIQPRAATVFSHEIALPDTDRQLIANGITTACHGMTYSWEGGLRGRDAALGLLDKLAASRRTFHADHRVHLRFENHHIDGVADAREWIAQGKISLLTFNEHLPAIARKAQSPEQLAAYAERARCDTATFRERVERACERSGEVDPGIETLASTCRRYGIPMASHDDETQEDRSRYQKLSVAISEFPRTEEALRAAIGFGNRVIMGAPNVLLGGSHCGGLPATDAVRSGQCQILASDYYYPSLLHAPFKLAFVDKACTLAHAWRLVSRNPADALGLRDRGRLADGCRADILLVDPSPSGSARLVATIAAGKLAYCAEPGRLCSLRAHSLVA